MPYRAGIPETTIQRLPMYLRCLLDAQSQRLPLVNSAVLAEMCGTNAAQIRKDFSYLGELGTRGIGYDVDALIVYISRVLGIDELRRVVLVGYGRFGSALLGYPGFTERGFEIVAVLDADPAKIGTFAGDVVISDVADLEDVVASAAAEIAVLATPAPATQALADRLVRAGIRGILNLAPVRLAVPDDVSVRHVCLSTELQVLSFHLAQKAL